MHQTIKFINMKELSIKQKLAKIQVEIEALKSKIRELSISKQLN